MHLRLREGKGSLLRRLSGLVLGFARIDNPQYCLFVVYAQVPFNCHCDAVLRVRRLISCVAELGLETLCLLRFHLIAIVM